MTNKTFTSAVSDVYGDDPVIDAFDLNPLSTYQFTIADDYVTGSMIEFRFNSQKQKVVITGSRGRAFSKYNAVQQTLLGTSSAELQISSRKSIRTQPWFELVGNIRVSQHIDYNERFFDSMCPAIDDLLASSSASGRSGVGLFPSSVFTAHEANIGFIELTNNQSSLLGINNLFFPFEAQFANIKRTLDVSDSFVAKWSYLGGLTPITPQPVRGLNFFWEEPAAEGVPGILDFYTDINLATGKLIELTTHDATKVLFGFGKFIPVIQYNYTGSLTAMNASLRLPEFHYYITDDGTPNITSSFSTEFLMAPTIRGWRYGLMSGTPLYNQAYFSTRHFGHVRDMLEQRLDTITYNEGSEDVRAFQGVSAVTVTFLSSSLTLDPTLTDSSNLSQFATSSLPYFDGQIRNR